MSHGVDVTINITAHNEGILFYKTLRSIKACILHSIRHGFKQEVNISLDNSDAITIQIANSFKDSLKDEIDIKLFRLSYGDLSLSRNYLISKSKGQYISFFDADDFFTENFISEALSVAIKNNKPACYSAKYMIDFEKEHSLTVFEDTNSSKFSKHNFFNMNYFISQNLVHREIYENIKYTEVTEGYGFEDWQFNCEVIAEGYEFYTVPNTIFFYRRKKNGSMLYKQLSQNVQLRKSKLFDPKKYVLLRNSTLIEQEGFDKTITFKQKKSLIMFAKDSLKRHSLLYNYLKTQYNIHTDTFNSFTKRIQKHNHVEHHDDLKIKSLLPRLKDIGFNDKLITLWGNLNQYEPLIRSSWDMQEYIPINHLPSKFASSDNYYEICLQFGNVNFTDIVIVPHMHRGGAELAIINLVSTLSKLNKKILVVSTLKHDSPWAFKINKIKNAQFLDSRIIFKSIDNESEQIAILFKTIQNWNIKNISIINSKIGYEMLSTYSKIIKNSHYKVYIHTYAYDVTEDGFIFNFIPNGLVDAYPVIKSYVTDSNYFKEKLIEINGFNRSQVESLYLPVKKVINKKTDYIKKRKIIYASRICYQKIADVAVEVGKMLASDNIELHFYGNIDKEYAENNTFFNLIENVPEIHYCGSFDDYRELNLNNYDMLLLTTRTEGMANIILEACASDIFVISAQVGGLPECITQGENGILISDADKFKPECYYSAILRAYQRDMYSNTNVIQKANKTVLKRHSIENYEYQLQKIIESDESSRFRK